MPSSSAFSARRDGGIGAGAGRQLDQRHEIGRVEPMRVEEALAGARPRRTRSSTRMVEVVEAMIGSRSGERESARQRLALEVEHFRHAFEDDERPASSAPARSASGTTDTRAAMRSTVRRSNRPKPREAWPACRALLRAPRPRAWRKPPASRGLKSTSVTVPGIGEHHGDAAPHAAGAEAGDASRARSSENPSRSSACSAGAVEVAKPEARQRAAGLP